jgi:hypothetical protein
MTDSSRDADDAAIVGARRALGLDASLPARTWSVARVLPVGRDYLLVVFGPPEHALAIAAVDPVSGEVLESAKLPGSQPHSVMTATEAIRRADFGPDTQARLVWDPSLASRSRFYPMWLLQSAQGRVWVDSVRGEVSHTLEATRGGGSGPA